MKNKPDDITFLQSSDFSDIVSSSDDCDLKGSEPQILLITRIAIIVMSFVLLVCTLINIYTHIIKNSRFRNISDLLFYINAVLIIVATVLVCLYPMPNENVCSLDWLIADKTPEFLNYNLGICQASTLTQLIIKLRQVFGLKHDSYLPESEIESVA